MKLSKAELLNKDVWANANIALPNFDKKAVCDATAKDPTWIHFGAGNIFRAFPAAVMQKLLNEGIENKGIIVAEGYDYEIIDKLFDPYDNLTLLVTLKADGTIEKTVIDSMTEALKVDSANTAHWNRLCEIFRAPSLQMVSFTITEKGYSLVLGNGELIPNVAEDMKAGPKSPNSYIGKLVGLLHERFLAGELPLALVSMDNCSHNGTKLHDAVLGIANKWLENGLCDPKFIAYLENGDKVSYPWSMIDKITPRPDDSVKEMLKEVGFNDVEGTVTSKNTFIAPFVNAEETQWLVIEDHFPNGHPALEKGGILFAERETVDKVEKMKVCTCLNPLHTALAIFGCLLGYTKISDEMKDVDLVNLIKKVGYVEGLPVVVNPEILDPKAFIDNVVDVRLPNPFMPDTPQRIATDTSQKLSIRFGETIKAYGKSDELDVNSLKAIPVVLAGWCRYLLAVDDNGNAFDRSADPMLEEVSAYVNGIVLGADCDVHSALKPLLSNSKIFGVDLYEASLAEKVEVIFAKMIKGAGAIRKVLQEEV